MIEFLKLKLKFDQTQISIPFQDIKINLKLYKDYVITTLLKKF